jgi:hypothetical protein
MTLVGRTLNAAVFLAAMAFVLWKNGIGLPRLQGAQDGTLDLTILDSGSGEPTPARVEVLDSEGKGHVAEDALLIADKPIKLERPWSGTVDDALKSMSREFRHAYARSSQFYTAGRAHLSLRAGAYQVKAFKGIEYQAAGQSVSVEAGRKTAATLRLGRWTDPRKTGWYSSDDHLHIARPYAELDPHLSKWLQGEDIHVANLLQFGNVEGFHDMAQRSHGPKSVYREGDYLLVSGQENPRTHMLGHTIILGASTPIHFPESYVIYRLFWEEARRQGALSGYAHAGLYNNAIGGLSIDLPHRLLNFIEVMQFEAGALYDVWYNVLNTGFSLAPTAGTDYPWYRRPPGRERFYTKVGGPLSFEAWLEGLSRGRTFVTNGPMLELRAEGGEIGDEVVLKRPGSIRVEGRVWFDPERDDVERLELIKDGALLRTFERPAASAEIRCSLNVEMREAGWVALRASGKRVSENRPNDALAHTGAIYVRIEGLPGRAETPRAKALATFWTSRLRELERQYSFEIDLQGQSPLDERVPVEYLRKNQSRLLDAIRSSRRYFEQQAR